MSSITVTATGGDGGSHPGSGAVVTATFPVTAGDVYDVVVGQKGLVQSGGGGTALVPMGVTNTLYFNGIVFIAAGGGGAFAFRGGGGIGFGGGGGIGGGGGGGNSLFDGSFGGGGGGSYISALGTGVFNFHSNAGNGATAVQDGSVMICYVANCPDFTSVTPAIPTIVQSTCNTVMGMPMGGSTTAPGSTGCPSESKLKYSVDGGATFTDTVPDYNQTTAITIMTTCVCDIDTGMTSDTSTVSTVPGVCPTGLTFNSAHALMSGDPCSCSDPLNCDVSGVTYFHDTLLVTTGGTTGLSITAAAGAVDFYIDVPCQTGGPTLIPVGTAIPETPAGSGIYKIEFWRPSGVTPTLSVIESGLTTPVPSMTFEPVCFQATCEATPVPTVGQWCLIALMILMMILGIVAVRTRKIIL